MPECHGLKPYAAAHDKLARVSPQHILQSNWEALCVPPVVDFCVRKLLWSY